MFLVFNPLNAQLNPICHLLELLGAHHIFHVSRIRVNPSKYSGNYMYSVLQDLRTLRLDTACTNLFAACASEDKQR